MSEISSNVLVFDSSLVEEQDFRAKYYNFLSNRFAFTEEENAFYKSIDTKEKFLKCLSVIIPSEGDFHCHDDLKKQLNNLFHYAEYARQNQVEAAFLYYGLRGISHYFYEGSECYQISGYFEKNFGKDFDDFFKKLFLHFGR